MGIYAVEEDWLAVEENSCSVYPDFAETYVIGEGVCAGFNFDFVEFGIFR